MTGSADASSYQALDVPVRGGDLRVGCWRGARAGQGPERIVLAVHGITSSHAAWVLVAQQLISRDPTAMVLAPDLRGRGRSADLPGPWGMAGHADDLAAVLAGVVPGRRVVLAGHSMGGFVAVMLAARYPDLVEGVVLVDGGVPLVLPPGWTLPEAARVGLGPAAQRLSMTFADRSDYQRFWQDHPAFAGGFSTAVRDYVDYDLRPDGPPWRSSSSAEAMAADHAEQFVDGPVHKAWAQLQVPASLLRAPRGLQDEPGGLYSESTVAAWQQQHPGFEWWTVEDVNHYTITLSDRGADAVSAAIAERLPSVPDLAAP